MQYIIAHVKGAKVLINPETIQTATFEPTHVYFINGQALALDESAEELEQMIITARRLN